MTTHATDRTDAKQNLRGSTLVLGGRAFALLLNFVGQVLTVRYLGKLDFGAFAFAISVVAGFSSLIVFGLDKSISRFAAIFHERQQHDKLLGTIILCLGTVTAIGLGTVATVLVAGTVFDVSLASNELTHVLLLLLIVLAPINALDSVMVLLFGAFASPRAIVVRRHVVGPVLKLLAVLAVVVSGGDAMSLAVGHLVAGVLGLLLCIHLLVHLARKGDLGVDWRATRPSYPARELYSFSVTLLASDLTMIFRTSLIVVLIEWMCGGLAVADFRAVFPLARLNEVVMTTFALLFIPTAARLFAQQRTEQLNHLYWQTAAWMTTLSFPLFAASFVFAEPLTVFCFGEQYASSGTVLAIMALGCFVQTMFGFSGQTLRVYGHVGYVVSTELLALAIAVATSFIVIPTHGAVGAAFATTAALLLQKVMHHVGVVARTGVKVFERRFAGTYLAAALGIVALMVVKSLWNPPLVVGLLLIVLASLVVLRSSRQSLELATTLPELSKLPFLRHVVKA